jgi:hypothetical protein
MNSQKLFSLLTLFLALFFFTGCTNSPTSNTQENNTASNPNAEIIKVGHNGLQFVPSTIKLTKGKQYSIEVTPSSDGKGCMTEVMIPGKGPHAIKNGEKFTIAVDGSSAKTIPLVCASMGMKQGEIVVE